MTTIAYSKPRSPRPIGANPLQARLKTALPADGGRSASVNKAWLAQQGGGGAHAAGAAGADVARMAYDGKVGRPQQAQGRDVVNQGGQQGVVGRGGNFQALGDAALSKLPAPAPAPAAMPQPKLMPSAPMFRGGNSQPLGTATLNHPGVFGIETGTGAGAGTSAGAGTGDGVGGDIQTAIQGLKSQLGMPAGADAAMGMPSSGPGSGASYLPPGGARAVAERFRNLSPEQQMAASVNVRPDAAARLRSVIGGGLRGAGADAGAASGAGGFMPGQPNPYADILRQRLGAGAGVGAGGGGGMAGQYAY